MSLFKIDLINSAFPKLPTFLYRNEIETQIIKSNVRMSNFAVAVTIGTTQTGFEGAAIYASPHADPSLHMCPLFEVITNANEGMTFRIMAPIFNEFVHKGSSFVMLDTPIIGERL